MDSSGTNVREPSMEMNQEAYETFWYWIGERHSIFLKKELGEPKPWTDDYVLRNWKFCNPFRNNDKQSRFLKNVLDQHVQAEPGLILFNIFVFRAFNWYPTYQTIGGWQDKWNENDIVDLLEHLVVQQGKQLTSGAYMIRGAQGMKKYESIPATLTEVWTDRDRLANLILNEIPPALETTYEILSEPNFWGWGPFTTYQVVLDLLESPLLRVATDLNSWCEFGPGAKRGLACIFPSIRNRDLLERSQYLYKQSRFHLPPHVPLMTLQDIEFSLCELSKYIRIKGGGHGKEGYPGNA